MTGAFTRVLHSRRRCLPSGTSGCFFRFAKAVTDYTGLVSYHHDGGKGEGAATFGLW